RFDALAALGGRWVEFLALFIVVQRRRAPVNDPDVVLFVGPKSDRLPEEKAAGRLRPQGVDFEYRRLHHRALRFGLVLQYGLADAQRDDAAHKGNAGDELAISLDHVSLPGLPIAPGRAQNRRRPTPCRSIGSIIAH